MIKEKQNKQIDSLLTPDMKVFKFNIFKISCERNLNIFLLLIVILFLNFNHCLAQKVKKALTISGVVLEHSNDESIPGANIVVKGTTIGTTTDFDGNFTLSIPTYKKTDSVTFSFVGFQSKTISIKNCRKGMSVKLLDETQSLDEIVLTPDYTYDELLMKRVIKNKSKNNPKHIANLEVKEEVQTSVYLSNLKESYKNQGKFKKSQAAFIRDVDSSYMLPVFVSTETFETSIVKGNETKVITDVSEKSILENLNDILKNTVDNKLADNFNFYTDVIQIFNKPIPSPISSSYKLYYNVYLVDSLVYEDDKKYKFNYFPKSKHAPALKGFFWVDNKDYAVNKIYAEIPITANINFIKKYNVDYTYKKWTDDIWYPNKCISDAALVLAKGSQKEQKEFRIQKETGYSPLDDSDKIETKSLKALNFHLDPSNTAVSQTLKRTDLPSTEDALHGINVLKENPFVKAIDKLGSMTLSGYYSARKIDVGPYFDFFYKNDIEGNRYNIPLRTSEQLSENFSIGGYIGYGSKDEEIKYGLNYNYLFPTPRRLVMKLRYMNDYRALARNPFKEFIQENPYGQGSGNILTIFQNKDLNPFLLKQQYAHASFEYQITPEIQLIARPFYRNFESNEGNPFMRNGVNVKNLRNPGILLDFRYSRDLTYEQAFFSRIYYGAAEPICHVTAEIGQTSLDSEAKGNPYAHINASVKKIIFIGPTKIKAFFDVGTIAGKVPYPLYYNPESVQGIALARYAYNLMNDYALSSTTYSNLHILANGGGIIFNKIPGINKLKLREAVSFKMFNGRLDTRSGGLFEDHYKVNQPKDEPYMEIGAGISNIFSFLRIEYLHRINTDPFFDTISSRSAVKFRMEVSF